MNTTRTNDLPKKTLPSLKEIVYDYDDGTDNKARLRHIITPEGVIDYAYSCGSNVESVTKGSESVTWTYDGSLVTSSTSAGTLAQVLPTVAVKQDSRV